MRFETSEVVTSADVQLVLNALRDHLVPISLEVDRSGEVITAFGIGPSPRAANPRDRSVFRVERVGGGTRVLAEVEFQASALLGGMDQGAAVRERIEGVLRMTREEVEASAPLEVTPVRVVRGERRDPRYGLWLVAVAVVCLAAVLLAAYLGGRSGRKAGGRASATPARVAVEPRAAAKPSPIPEGAEVRGGKQRAAVEGAGRPDRPETSIDSGGRGEAGDRDLWDRLEEWAGSMMSTDAAAQTAFYAPHMDRYFLRTDVTNGFVLKDKEDFIRRGNRVRRFDLRDVEIQEETDSTARVRLVKHYVLEGKRAGSNPERRVRSELQLRKIDGIWKIVVERDFR